MDTDYKSFQHSKSSLAEKPKRKGLARSSKIELAAPKVYDNDGFDEEDEEDLDDEYRPNIQARSKENKTFDPSNFNISRVEVQPKDKYSSYCDSAELKEQNTNLRKTGGKEEQSQMRAKSGWKNITNNLNVLSDNKSAKPQIDDKSDFFNIVLNTRPNLDYSYRMRTQRPSLTAEMLQRGFNPDQPDAGSMPFTRSLSMRTPDPPPIVQKPRRRLLRDMSFSDSDDVVTKNYGSLGKVPLPRRLSESDVPTQNSRRILRTTMQELIDRGKVHQVMVLDLDTCDVIASLPETKLTRSDALGLTKSLMCFSTIFKLHVNGEMYTCFKHSPTAIQGRSDDVVMVLQKTITCLVAAFSDEDAPGACQSEVMEFAQVLERADW